MRISVFDLDHTLFKVNASFRFGMYLYKKKVFSTAKMLRLSFCYASYKLGFISMLGLHKKIFKCLFLGQSLKKFEELAKAFVDEHFHILVNHLVLEKLALAQENGHYTTLFSSSPDFLVKIIAKKFNVNCWRASGYQTDQTARFCQLEEILTGDKKAKCLNELIQTLNANLSDCEAYSDSYEDLPLLELVGKPVVVNPDKKLQTFSVKKNWEMI